MAVIKIVYRNTYNILNCHLYGGSGLRQTAMVALSMKCLTIFLFRYDLLGSRTGLV